MSKMKEFGKYILWIVAFYIISNILIYFCITTSYSPMEKNINSPENMQININYAKATLINGKVEGTIKNATSEAINQKYVKFEFISKRGNTILTKYAKIEGLEPNEEKDFSVSFTAENIKKVNITISDEYQKDENTKLVNLDMLKNETTENKFAAFVSVFVLVHCLL